MRPVSKHPISRIGLTVTETQKPMRNNRKAHKTHEVHQQDILQPPIKPQPFADQIGRGYPKEIYWNIELWRMKSILEAQRSKSDFTYSDKSLSDKERNHSLIKTKIHRAFSRLGAKNNLNQAHLKIYQNKADKQSPKNDSKSYTALKG